MQAKVIHPFNSDLTVVSAATTTVTFNTPLTFSDFPSGIYLYVLVDGLERVGGNSSSTYTLRVIAKNSSNATVNIDAGQMIFRYNQGSNPLIDATIIVKSNGSGTCIFPHGTSGINYMGTTVGFTSSAITQITGFSVISSIGASSFKTRGAMITAYGIK